MKTRQKFQQVSFRDVDEFLDALPEDELKVVIKLRSIVLDCIPHVTEKLAYNVPFYQLHRNICFIWPASVLWGVKRTFDGVRFGFTNGNLLRDEINYLDKGNRKQIYWKVFSNTGDIDKDLLKAYIYEAVELDARRPGKSR